MTYAIHCPTCGVVTCDENTNYTEAWSGWKYRCKEHKEDPVPFPLAPYVPVYSYQDRTPTAREQDQARAAMRTAEVERESRELFNRRRSAVVALQVFGEAALHRPHVTDEDRRLMKALLDGKNV